MKLLKRAKNWSIYILVRIIVLITRGVPRTWAFVFFRFLSLLFYALLPKFRKKTIDNLQLAFGHEKSSKDIKRLAKKVFCNLGRNAVDAIRLHTFTSGNIDRYVKAVGIENLNKALQKGRGVLAITGHIGNWELLGGYLAIKGYPLNVISAPLYDPRLNKIVVQTRERTGLRNFTRRVDTRKVLRALRRGEMIGVLIDQDTRVEGAFVNFFGKKAFTPVGPVVLAMKTGAAIVPLAIRIMADNSHLITVREEIPLQHSGNPETDITVNTQRCTEEIESFIRQDPTQWVWMHDRWKTKEKTSEDNHGG